MSKAYAAQPSVRVAAAARTTVTLDKDIARAVEQIRRERGLGTSAAVNELARRGLAVRDTGRGEFRQSVSTMGRARVPLDDVSAALDLLEGDAHRE